MANLELIRHPVFLLFLSNQIKQKDCLTDSTDRKEEEIERCTESGHLFSATNENATEFILVL